MEVDFIIDDRTPAEVKSSPGKPAVGKSLRSFIDKYRPAEAYVFNKGVFETIQINGADIRFLHHFINPG